MSSWSCAEDLGDEGTLFILIHCVCRFGNWRRNFGKNSLWWVFEAERGSVATRVFSASTLVVTSSAVVLSHASVSSSSNSRQRWQKFPNFLRSLSNSVSTWSSSYVTLKQSLQLTGNTDHNWTPMVAFPALLPSGCWSTAPHAVVLTLTRKH